MRRDLFRTTQTGCLLAKDLPLLGETLDASKGNSVISTFAPALRPARPWRSQIMASWLIVSVTYWEEGQLRCVLSREGQVNIYGPGGKPDHTYQIPEAGVFGEAASGLGYVNRIVAIGDHLYVCGQSRQVWRFEWDGKDLASGRWVDAAGPMRQPAISNPPDDPTDEQAFDRWLDDNDAVDLVDIAGASDSDIYAVGDQCWHWDGHQWQQLSLPTDEPLAAIKVMSPEQVCFVGHNGTLLVGNARDGCAELSGVDDNQNFTGVEWFGDRLFLASNSGLFTFDPASRRIERYATDLQPDLQDTHVLEAKDGILWSFGFKDLVWFDGTRWTRVDHPDNPPIR